jgi:lipoate-protein ligase A
MRCLDLTLPTPEENLALDEALLEEAESAAASEETLRFWEPSEPMVVVGRSSRVEAEVQVDVCRTAGIPIFRRPSGGAAIVAGPGCLMYALVLSYEKRPELRPIAKTHDFVLKTIAAALRPSCPGVHCAGTSDLALGAEKFSGNSMRARRRHFLYHGTLLYQFPLERIDHYLKQPLRMPAYRHGRKHAVFVTNLPLPREAIVQGLTQAWKATDSCPDWPRALTARLAAERYSQAEWNGVD